MLLHRHIARMTAAERSRILAIEREKMGHGR